MQGISCLSSWELWKAARAAWTAHKLIALHTALMLLWPAMDLLLLDARRWDWDTFRFGRSATCPSQIKV